MPENTRLKNSNFDEVFGELQAVHRVRRGCFDYLFIPLLVFIFLAGAVAYFYDTRDWVAVPCCIVPTFLMLAAILRHLLTTRKDELRIYENGFTYRSGGKLQTCLWTEIETCRQRARHSREIGVPVSDDSPLGSVEKKNGETIVFENDLTGTPEITARFDRRKT